MGTTLKEQQYIQILPQAESIISEENDIIANMSNLSALLHRAFGFWWTGFYRAVGEELVLGPFQGPLACTRIPFGKGVCGCAWQRKEAIVVPDVNKFPGHIACSSESRSEIVIPIWKDGKITAVLDIDSDKPETFDDVDRKYLERICTILSVKVSPSLKSYIESQILPRYDAFDMGHRRDHAEYVISQALLLASHYSVNPDMVYAAAAFHDTGLCEDRKTHHTVSARIIREDSHLAEWFSPAEIDIIADAAEDHRASSKHEPRTIYGKLIAEADRQIIPEVVIRRTIQFALKNYPDMDREGHWKRTLDHLHEKYAEGGYLKLWIPESDNAARLEELRSIIRDEKRLKSLFEKIFSTLVPSWE